MNVSTHDLTYCHHRERGLIQHCPWKTLCCLLPTPAPSNPVLAHCRCDCRVSQNRATRETTVDKLRDQSGIESVIVHANKGEEMVEGQEPAQGQNPFGCNLSRSGSCCLGKRVTERFHDVSKQIQEQDFSKKGLFSLSWDRDGDQCRDPQHQVHCHGQRDLLLAAYFSSVCCTVNPDWRLSLALMAEEPSCMTPYICTHVFTCVNTSAEK